MLFGLPRITVSHSKAAIAALRIASSLAWLDSAFVGADATFARSFMTGPGLVMRIHATFAHTAIDPRITTLLTVVVVPHAAIFATLIAFADAAAGISLALGLFTRAGAAIAILRALSNIAVSGGAGADTVGYNLLLIAVSAACWWTAAGRKFGLDHQLIERAPQNRLLRRLG